MSQTDLREKEKGRKNKEDGCVENGKTFNMLLFSATVAYWCRVWHKRWYIDFNVPVSDFWLHNPPTQK